MSHSVLAAVVIPIVVIIALAAWLFMVYRAERHSGDGGHPETSHRAVPRRDVADGLSAAAAAVRSCHAGTSGLLR